MNIKMFCLGYNSNMMAKRVFNRFLHMNPSKYSTTKSGMSSIILSSQQPTDVPKQETHAAEVNDTLNPEICQLLCALCAPGTESISIAETQRENTAPKRAILRTENIDQRSKMVPITNASIAETFGSDIGALHVTYIEPKIANLSKI